MMVKGSFAEILWPGIKHALEHPEWEEWKWCGYSSRLEWLKAVYVAMAERDDDPEFYDRMTEGMMPRIPK